jgi:hypothetical protein
VKNDVRMNSLTFYLEERKILLVKGGLLVKNKLTTWYDLKEVIR